MREGWEERSLWGGIMWELRLRNTRHDVLNTHPALNPELGAAEKRALQLSHCISTAGGDVAKIQRCQRKFLK